MTAGQRDLVKCEVARRQGIDIVKGEVLEIEERKYVVGRFYGKEVQWYSDAGTQVTGAISPGDSIEAIVSGENDEKRLLSIRQMIPCDETDPNEGNIQSCQQNAQRCGRTEDGRETFNADYDDVQFGMSQAHPDRKWEPY